MFSTILLGRSRRIGSTAVYRRQYRRKRIADSTRKPSQNTPRPGHKHILSNVQTADDAFLGRVSYEANLQGMCNMPLQVSITGSGRGTLHVPLSRSDWQLNYTLKPNEVNMALGYLYNKVNSKYKSAIVGACFFSELLHVSCFQYQQSYIGSASDFLHRAELS